VVQDDQTLTGVEQIDGVLRCLRVRPDDLGLRSALEPQARDVVQQDHVPLPRELIREPSLRRRLRRVRPHPAALVADGGDGAEEVVDGDTMATGDDEDATDHGHSLGSAAHGRAMGPSLTWTS
jgi:hypothetical protein